MLTFEGQSTGGGPTMTTISLGSFGGFPLGERDSGISVGDCEEKKGLLLICLPTFDVWNLKPSVYFSPP